MIAREAEKVGVDVQSLEEKKKAWKEDTQEEGSDSSSAYRQGTVNTNVCTDGTSDITNSSACRFAARRLKLTWIGNIQQRHDRPKNCYVRSKRVFWNADRTGGAHPLRRPICIAGGARGSASAESSSRNVSIKSNDRGRYVNDDSNDLDSDDEERQAKRSRTSWKY